MAYLTYRNKANVVTTAQTEKRNIELGRPLNINEVDANFAAISADLDKIMLDYGVGTSRSNCRAINEMYGSNNANVIKNTGFYSTNTATTNMPVPSTDEGNMHATAILHIENGLQKTADDVGAIQLTGNETYLWYRARQGTSSWNKWSRVANIDDLQHVSDMAAAAVSSVVDGKVTRSGDTVTGVIAFDYSEADDATKADVIDKYDGKQLIFVNEKATKNPNEISEANAPGISFYDKNGTSIDSNRLASISNYFKISSSNDVQNAVIMHANDPTAPNTEKRAELKVGWRRILNKNGTRSMAAYAEAPRLPDASELDTTAAENANLVATVGWAESFIQDKINFVMDTSNYITKEGGAIVGGNLYINSVEHFDDEGQFDGYRGGDLTVTQNVNVGGELLAEYVECGDGLSSYNAIYMGLDNSLLSYDQNPEEEYLNGIIFGVDNESAEGGDDEPYMGRWQHGGVLNVITTQGHNKLSFAVKPWSESDYKGRESMQEMGIAIDNNGKAYTFAPHPEDGDYANKIATTKWVKDNITSISESIGGELDFGEMS